MEKAKAIKKVTRLLRHYVPRETPKGTVLNGPYWYGYWQENGRTIKVYLGKELQKELEYLIKKRHKKPGYQQYTWPRPRG
ncbi:unnamed protein product [marine sediment metagenome]|uniref:DUF6788 domain-containing protein n=1 Tax=marine sediment metagenome TaxID=412755 RepID=X1V5X5_9ZZZZ